MVYMNPFNNPISPKVKKEKSNSPWDFRCPPYDKRSSCFMDGGTHFGEGHRNPVGHIGPAKQRVSTLPYGMREGKQVDNAPRQKLDQVFIE